jgi:hypothetical protein
MGASGTHAHAPMLLQEVTWICCNGREQMVASGTHAHVTTLLKEAIWRCCNGHEQTAVSGTQTYVPMLLQRPSGGAALRIDLWLFYIPLFKLHKITLSGVELHAHVDLEGFNDDSGVETQLDQRHIALCSELAP